MTAGGLYLIHSLIAICRAYCVENVESEALRQEFHMDYTLEVKRE